MRNDEQAMRRILEGGGGQTGRLVRSLLWLPGRAYGLAMRLRRAAYDCGVLASLRPPVPVISIGNLTAGGTGKTPMTAWLARELHAMGHAIAILMRGYRADGGVSDEAALYHDIAPHALVVVNRNRRAGAAEAMRKGARVLLLDDGLQHLKVRRDLDIILIDALSPWGGGNTLPGGLLREGKRTLAVAGAVVVTRSDQVAAASLQTLLSEITTLAPQAAVFTARHAPARLTALDGTPRPLSSLRGKRVVALSGIARPEAFHATLVQLGAVVAGQVTGRDHADFSRADIDRAVSLAAARGAVVVMTEKDRARRIFSRPGGETADNPVTGSNAPPLSEILTLGVEQDIDGKDRLLELLAGRISSLQFAPGPANL